VHHEGGVMRQDLSTTPAAWLSGSPIPVPHSGSILSTFLPGTAMNPNSTTTPMFKGNGEQVYFKSAHGVNSLNPLWVYPVRLW
jgi:hypothetical protein